MILQSLLCLNNYSIEVSENTRPPENPPEKDEDDKVKFQEYILPLFMDFAKDNKIDPMVCYEVRSWTWAKFDRRLFVKRFQQSRDWGTQTYSRNGLENTKGRDDGR